MPTRNINLTPKLDKVVQRCIASGEYESASEVVREGLRLLDEKRKLRAMKLRNLRKAAKEGFDAIDRGEYTLIRSPEEHKEYFDRIAAEGRAGESRRGSDVLEIVYSSLAHLDIADIEEWSANQFGAKMTERYLLLIRSAVDDLASDPVRLGAVDRPDLGGGHRIYHLYHSRRRSGRIVVRKPGHFVLVRVRGKRLEVGRILHDEMDVDRRIADEGFGEFE